MHSLVYRSIRHLYQEPHRELFKFKYRNFRFRGLSYLFERIQPKYKKRLKWQVVDAALGSQSEDAVEELGHIFAAAPDALDGIYTPIKSFLSGCPRKARQEAKDIADDDTAVPEVRTAAFFLDMLMASPRVRKDTQTELPHIQYWDKSPPRDVERLLKNWEGEIGQVSYRLFNDEAAKKFIKDNFDAQQVKAYECCNHASAKSDLVRFCTLYHFGGTYSDADSAPRHGIDAYRRCLTERQTFWIASDLDFHARTWFLASCPKAKIFEHFIIEATKRLTNTGSRLSMFSLAGPGMTKDVMFQNRNESWVSETVAAFTNCFGEANLMQNVSPSYKEDARSWQVFEGMSPKRRGLLKNLARLRA